MVGKTAPVKAHFADLLLKAKLCHFLAHSLSSRLTTSSSSSSSNLLACKQRLARHTNGILQSNPHTNIILKSSAH
jgi:hypothetical protein